MYRDSIGIVFPLRGSKLFFRAEVPVVVEIGTVLVSKKAKKASKSLSASFRIPKGSM